MTAPGSRGQRSNAIGALSTFLSRADALIIGIWRMGCPPTVIDNQRYFNVIGLRVTILPILKPTIATRIAVNDGGYPATVPSLLAVASCRGREFSRGNPTTHTREGARLPQVWVPLIVEPMASSRMRKLRKTKDWSVDQDGNDITIPSLAIRRRLEQDAKLESVEPGGEG